jgi:antirestriction protein ArdC
MSVRRSQGIRRNEAAASVLSLVLSKSMTDSNCAPSLVAGPSAREGAVLALRRSRARLAASYTVVTALRVRRSSFRIAPSTAHEPGLARLQAKKEHFMTKSSFDLYAHVTNTIVAAIEAGGTSFSLPWQRTGLGEILPINAATCQAYNGINIVSLWATAMDRGYERGLWATYRQWISLGAQVRKGERGSCVVFYKQYEVEPDQDDTDDDGLRRFARASFVFNATQVDGFELPGIPDLPPVERLQRAESLIAQSGAIVEHGGEQAYYSRSRDCIHMPDERLFAAEDASKRSEDYYAVLFHELTHWTGVENRLDRLLGKRFGDHAYAMEELVAELGSAFLCGSLSITPQPRADHAGYIAHWLDAMKADKRAIFSAAAKASEAVAYLRGLRSGP